MKNKIFYVLPTFNEGLNIIRLLKKFDNFFKKHNILIIIVFVDDGSTDNSIEKIVSFKKKNSRKIKIKILKHKKNYGLGVALKTGFKFCFKFANEDDVIVTMDTDNSHTIDLSFKMVKKIIFDNEDVVIASRYRENSKTKGLNNLRKILSFGAALLFKIFFPIKNVRDYTSGFRAFKVKKIRNIYKKSKNFFSETGFSASADILLKLYPFKKELNFKELPINLRYDLKQGSSKMKIIKTIYLNLRLIFIRKIF
tara:strand:- start:1318 stop:2076 length:759 start_codon:yes stop_codon:yes gene_type:complete